MFLTTCSTVIVGQHVPRNDKMNIGAVVRRKVQVHKLVLGSFIAELG
jgi:hypothetical protein